MFGKDHGSFGPPSSNDELFDSCSNILELAEQALSEGDLAQASHLYLAAFDASENIGTGAYQPAIEGLRKAWDAACTLKDRALAEHIFEKLEPFSTSEEVAEHAEALQRLALDKLEEFGFSREDLQDMADMVSEDFIGAFKENQGPEAVVAQVLSVGKNEIRPLKSPLSWPHASQASEQEIGQEGPGAPQNPEDFTYADLIGFDHAIDAMNKRGIGLAGDEKFDEFMNTLSRRHGISSLPAFETLLFRSPSREDANQFMLSTSKEIGVPSVRMYMEETPMGFPVLCILTTPDFKMNPIRGGFGGPGILMLEDIDIWGMPFSNSIEEAEGMPYHMQLSRGAREAVMFIRSAVENPEVQVMATCSSHVELDEFFAELLHPVDAFELALPDEEERAAIFEDIYSLYPSMRLLKSDDLIRLTANLSRFDLYMTAREAVDEAFKSSVEKRAYVPVTRDNFYNKIAAYQPLDSAEYLELEERAVESLRHDLESVDDLLKGNE